MSQRVFLIGLPLRAIREESDSTSEWRDSRCATIAPDSRPANEESSEPRGLGGRPAGLNRNRRAGPSHVRPALPGAQ